MVGLVLSGHIHLVQTSGASRLQSAYCVKAVDRWRTVGGAVEDQDLPGPSLFIRHFIAKAGQVHLTAVRPPSSVPEKTLARVHIYIRCGQDVQPLERTLEEPSVARCVPSIRGLGRQVIGVFFCF